MYCKTQGIKLEYTVSKTPELNGLAERMNQTIMESVRSMLSHANLPKSYWAETMLTIVYLINKVSLSAFKGRCPIEGVDRKTCLLPTLKGVHMFSKYACCKSSGQSWTSNPSHAYSWGTRKMSSATGCGIFLIRKW